MPDDTTAACAPLPVGARWEVVGGATPAAAVGTPRTTMVAVTLLRGSGEAVPLVVKRSGEGRNRAWKLLIDAPEQKRALLDIGDAANQYQADGGEEEQTNE